MGAWIQPTTRDNILERDVVKSNVYFRRFESAKIGSNIIQNTNALFFVKKNIFLFGSGYTLIVAHACLKYDPLKYMQSNFFAEKV